MYSEVREMMKYQNIIGRSRPMSQRISMSVRHRAKQFAPFAALKGFEELIRKQEIRYEPKRELSDEQTEPLDRKLHVLRVGDFVQAEFFQRQPYTSIGQYQTISGTIEFFDPSQYIQIGNTKISVSDMKELYSESLCSLDEPC